MEIGSFILGRTTVLLSGNSTRDDGNYGKYSEYRQNPNQNNFWTITAILIIPGLHGQWTVLHSSIRSDNFWCYLNDALITYTPSVLKRNDDLNFKNISYLEEVHVNINFQILLFCLKNMNPILLYKIKKSKNTIYNYLYQVPIILKYV